MIICWWEAYLWHKFVVSREGKGLLISSLQNEKYRKTNVILGINIMRSNNHIILSQSHYVEKILKCFDILECSPVSTPMDGSLKFIPHENSPISQISYLKIIGTLMYAMNSTRPDIEFSVGKHSRYTSNLKPMHWISIWEY